MQGQTTRTIIFEKCPGALGNRPTEAEHRLWHFLRGRRIENCRFRRQHPFGHYILDSVCVDRRLVVELDGSQHAGALDYDAARCCFPESVGLRVLRFWNNDVSENIEGVIELLTAALQQCDTPFPLDPPLEGEG